jgi:hypothetical protein
VKEEHKERVEENLNKDEFEEARKKVKVEEKEIENLRKKKLEK